MRLPVTFDAPVVITAKVSGRKALSSNSYSKFPSLSTGIMVKSKSPSRRYNGRNTELWSFAVVMICPLLKKDAMTKFKLSVTPEVNATFSGFALNKVAIFSRAS